MRLALALALLFLKLPFWETRTPEQWSDLEVEEMLYDSPWAQSLGPPAGVVVYLASAAPVTAAEQEQRRRGHARSSRPDFDYTDFLRMHRAEAIVLAVPYSRDFGTAAQQERMERESALEVGRAAYPILGYFPPVENDPVLRLAFPRRVDARDKSILFRLYLPGIAFPEREAEFKLKDLAWHGRTEM
jgi:hypothetical protein